jgi:SPP1 gp7 family putative phage head morphogenesis protein
MARMTREEQAAAVKKLRSLIRGRRFRRMPLLQPPEAQEREYRKVLLAYVERVQQFVAKRALPLLEQLPESKPRGSRADALDEKRVREVFSLIGRGLIQQTPDASLEKAAESAASGVATYQGRQLRRAFVSSLGVDLLTLMDEDPNLRPIIQDFTKQNVSLIRSISKRYLSEVEEIIIEAVQDGKKSARLIRDIAHRGEVARSRAELIAKDQMGKFYGRLNETRQQALGMKRYRWRTMRDEKVREEHAARDNEIFEWSDPPEDGHPGTPVNCRCYAEPIIEEVLGQLAA